MIDLSSFYESGRLGQNKHIPSPSTRRLEKLQRRVPVVGDKALIDLINGIQVSKDIIRYRKRRGFFSCRRYSKRGCDTDEAGASIA